MMEKQPISNIVSLVIGGIVTLVVLFGVYTLINSFIEKNVGYKYQEFRNQAVDGCMKSASSVVSNVFNESIYKLCMKDKGF